MILDIDWTVFALGMLIGTAAGALYFAGLAWSVRLALRGAHAAAVLLPSAVIRIALLLAAGWGTAQLGVPALVGFALAFLSLRFFMVTAVRPKDQSGATEWN
jgi:F0F1-type ATP synthase assembly protein I